MKLYIHLPRSHLVNCYLKDTVELGYQAHALIGIAIKQYALHNEVRQIAGVKG